LYVADDSVTADKLANSINTDIALGVAALPKAGGTMTGAINFSDTGENIHSPSAGILAIESRGPIQLWGDSNNNGASTSAVFEVLRDSTYSGGSGKSTLTVYDNGDISFYEDTGTTAKFFWDASAERLGIGTSSPSSALTVQGALTIRNSTQSFNGGLAAEVNTGILNFGLNEGSGNRFGGSYTQANQGGMLNFDTRAGEPLFQIYGRAAGTASASGTALFNLLSDGNVGIGTSNMGSDGLSLNNSMNFTMSEGANSSFLNIFRQASSAATVIANGYKYTDTANKVASSYASSWAKSAIALNYGNTIFYNDTAATTAVGTDVIPTEVMRIDSSGNVGIGTSSPSVPLQINHGSSSVGLYTLGSYNYQAKFESSDAEAAIVIEDSNSGTDYNRIGVITNDMAFTTNNAERMRIDSSGDIAIGSATVRRDLASNTSPVLSLEGTFPAINLRDSGTGYGGFFGLDGNTVYIGGHTDTAAMQVYVNGSEKMRIQSGGNVIFGVASEPTGSVGGSAFITDSVGRMNLILATTSTGNVDVANFRNPNGTVGKINTNGSSTVYNTSSDARLKDVTGSARGLEVINELNPVSYNWKVDGKADEGLIAQEVLDIVPNAVTGSEEEQYYMDYSKLVVHLVAGMKEQQTQIEALQSEINLLKGE